jgi:CheY-like chemotaxis protein
LIFSKILIADSDTYFQQVLIELVKKATAHDVLVDIQTVENGRQAKYSIMLAAPVILITEVFLPVFDGYQLIDYVKTNYPQTIVVAITDIGSSTLENQQSLELARQRGADFVFDKQHAAREIHQLMLEFSVDSILSKTLPD